MFFRIAVYSGLEGWPKGTKGPERTERRGVVGAESIRVLGAVGFPIGSETQEALLGRLLSESVNMLFNEQQEGRLDSEKRLRLRSVRAGLDDAEGDFAGLIAFSSLGSGSVSDRGGVSGWSPMMDCTKNRASAFCR